LRCLQLEGRRVLEVIAELQKTDGSEMFYSTHDVHKLELIRMRLLSERTIRLSPFTRLGLEIGCKGPSMKTTGNLHSQKSLNLKHIIARYLYIGYLHIESEFFFVS
jgi:hypothetical protein